MLLLVFQGTLCLQYGGARHLRHLVTAKETTRYHNLEDYDLNFHHYETLKYNNNKKVIPVTDRGGL
jgi:hypothetical protein